MLDSIDGCLQPQQHCGDRDDATVVRSALPVPRRDAPTPPRTTLRWATRLRRREPASLLDALPVSGWVHDVYVAPSARGSGAGAALLDGAVAALRGLGVGLVLLTVGPANAAAQRLVAQRGFAVTMHEMTLARAAGRPALLGELPRAGGGVVRRTGGLTTR